MSNISLALARPAPRAGMGLVILLVIGAIAAPQTLSVSVILGILPFIAILGLASVGQHLVIQQKGFDLSVGGTISLAAVMATSLIPAESSLFTMCLYVALVLLAGLGIGVVNGIVIALLGVSPLVTTIGMNAILLGLTLFVSGGVPNTAHPSLVSFASSDLLGLPTPFVISVAVVMLTAWVLGFTALGRRYIAVGVSQAAASILAIPVIRYRIGTYAVASMFYAFSGVLLAGFLVSPAVMSGSTYMLTTIAAVVVGGSPLNGDRGSVIATAIGVLFLIYLDQLVLSLGFEASFQSIVQATIILAGVALPVIAQRFQKG